MFSLLLKVTCLKGMYDVHSVLSQVKFTLTAIKISLQHFQPPQ